jgi:hypothetical protein
MSLSQVFASRLRELAANRFSDSATARGEKAPGEQVAVRAWSDLGVSGRGARLMTKLHGLEKRVPLKGPPLHDRAVERTQNCKLLTQRGLYSGNGTFHRTSSKYEPKTANSKILRLIGAKRGEKNGAKNEPKRT